MTTFVTFLAALFIFMLLGLPLSFVLITILRPLMTAVAVYYLDWGIVGVWVAICLDQILRSGCFTYILYQIKALPTMPAKA